MKLTEGHIHVAMRQYLRQNGWTLVAGQFPGGSDDELHILYVVDPSVARDQSPDPRRHSKGKLVPDLIALKGNDLLIVEAKPGYSPEDRDKLIQLLSIRRSDFLLALEKFAEERNFKDLLPLERLNLIPSLAFSLKSKTKEKDPGFVHLLVENLNLVRLEGPF